MAHIQVIIMCLGRVGAIRSPHKVANVRSPPRCKCRGGGGEEPEENPTRTPPIKTVDGDDAFIDG